MLDHAGQRTLLQRLDGHAAKTPYRTFACLYRGEAFQVLTYGDLKTRADAWAARIAGAARPEASKVAFIVLAHGFDLYAAYLGAMRAGLRPSFLPPPSPRQDAALYAAAHARVIARTDPALIVAGAAERAALQPVSPPGMVFLEPGPQPRQTDFAAAEPSIADLALLQHSSGTTGLKKAVALGFGQVDAHVGMVSAALAMGPGDIVASWLPLHHDMGLFAAFLVPLTLGASVVALDAQAWVADPMSLMRAVDRHRATLAWAPNFAFAHTARTRGAHPAVDLSSLRALIDCSEPCRPETLDAFAAAFADCGLTPDRLACCYGMAEVVFAATQTRPGVRPRALVLDAAALEEGRIAPAPREGRTRRLLSCGPPLPGVALRIDAPYAWTGEVLVRSATQIEGYATADTPDHAALPGGWRRTGDVGLIDGGELFVCGRLKEMLIVNGRNLYAGDVEAVVGGVAGAKPGRAVAMGIEDEPTGSEALAVMLEATSASVDEADLKRRVRAAVTGAFDVAVNTVAVAPPGWLVKSTAGKMSRAENLERLKALRDDGVSSMPMDDLGVLTPVPCPSPIRQREESLVRQALADCFGVDPALITAETSPDDIAGWDSLGHTTLLLRLETLTGVRLTERAAEARSVGELDALLAAPRTELAA